MEELRPESNQIAYRQPSSRRCRTDAWLPGAGLGGSETSKEGDEKISTRVLVNVRKYENAQRVGAADAREEGCMLSQALPHIPPWVVQDRREPEQKDRERIL
jgi:hypothetical protein